MPLTTKSPCSPSHSGNYSPGLQIFRTIRIPLYAYHYMLTSITEWNKLAYEYLINVGHGFQKNGWQQNVN